MAHHLFNKTNAPVFLAFFMLVAAAIVTLMASPEEKIKGQLLFPDIQKVMPEVVAINLDKVIATKNNVDISSNFEIGTGSAGFSYEVVPYVINLYYSPEAAFSYDSTDGYYKEYDRGSVNISNIITNFSDVNGNLPNGSPVTVAVYFSGSGSNNAVGGEGSGSYAVTPYLVVKNGNQDVPDGNVVIGAGSGGFSYTIFPRIIVILVSPNSSSYQLVNGEYTLTQGQMSIEYIDGTLISGDSVTISSYTFHDYGVYDNGYVNAYVNSSYIVVVLYGAPVVITP